MQTHGTPLLVIQLKNQQEVDVPGLSISEIEQIFTSYNRFISSRDLLKPQEEPDAITASLLEHNPEQSSLPPLPEKILTKLTNLIKSLGLDESNLMPKAEPHCQCVYCQVIRAVFAEPSQEEEEVTEEDLRFRDWIITEQSPHLYLVTNPLDERESYQVYLQDPIGCTCGSKTCEHIHAVLSTPIE